MFQINCLCLEKMKKKYELKFNQRKKNIHIYISQLVVYCNE